MSGFIQIHRKLIDWEWYTDANTFRVFMHCLIMANYKDKKYRGTVIKRGEFLSSYEILAKQTKLTVQKVRTSLTNLESTDEITRESTSRGTRITICNYDTYQTLNPQSNTPSNNQITNDQQSNNNQITTTNKENNIIIKEIVEYLNATAGTKYKSTATSTVKHITARLNDKYTIDDFKIVIDKKVSEWKETEQAKYIRPETLFGNKFEGYLNQMNGNNNNNQQQGQFSNDFSQYGI